MPGERLHGDILYVTEQLVQMHFEAQCAMEREASLIMNGFCVNWSGLYPPVLFRIILVLDFLGYHVPSYISCLGPLTSVFVHVFVSHIFSLPKQHKQGLTTGDTYYQAQKGA